MARRAAPSAGRAPALIFRREIHLPAERDAVAVPGLDVQGGAAVVEEGQEIEMLVFVGLDEDADLVAVPPVLGDAVVEDRRVEVQAMAPP